MRVPPLLPATLLWATAVSPCLALRPVVHTARAKSHTGTQHAYLQHATGHTATTHKSLHSATVVPHHESSAGIPPERATAIQAALIKQGYLSGEPSGTWDAQTAAAMTKLQSDNGWQTKITPDARALIKLGLGPQNGVPPGGAAQDGSTPRP